MNKKILTAALGLFTFSMVNAQLYINNAQLTIQAGASVIVQGDVTSNTNILGDGKLVLKGSAIQNVSMSGNTIPNLEIDNLSNATLTSSAKIGSTLLFTNGNIVLVDSNLTLADAATISNNSSSRFVVTTGNGKLLKSALSTTPFLFPIGNSAATYNPITISNTGTSDVIGARCLTNAYTAGTSGSTFTTDVVDATWDISEAVAGGSNLSITAQWNSTDTLAGFNRNKAGISNYLVGNPSTNGWDLLNSQIGTVSGTGPFTYTRSNVTNTGAFVVGSKSVLSPLFVSPKVFLSGCFNTGTKKMTDGLRSSASNLIPLKEPYTGTTGFTHSGSGGGETSLSSIVGPTAVADTNSVVDWVFVQLHRGSDSVVVSTRAALLQRDGDVVDVDGISPLNMAGNAPGNYFISIRHRNHLGVRSATSVSLNKATTTGYDFTTAQTKAYKGSVSNNPMALLTTGFYGMWAGNANDDSKVTMIGALATQSDYIKLKVTLGSSANTISNVYSKQDLNMDGKVTMIGALPTQSDYIRLKTTLGSSATTVTQPTF